MQTTTRDRYLAINYAATIFVSAFLLFQVQPLVSKYILPWFGGTPAVWTTCMLFFQVLLFAGYAYAHGTQTWLRPRQQALVHLGVLVAALALLRVLPGERWMPTDSNHPVAQILLLLAVTIGVPYFVLSTTGPLMQAWFARSLPGRSPYRLYALSNVGSLLALISYPLFFERMFDLPQQAAIWSCGFIAFALLCGYAAYRLWRSPPREGEAPAEPETVANVGSAGASPSLRAPGILECLAWLGLPAFASVTLLATTNYVCADIAVVPFLWIVPLSLYLVTFIIAFDRPNWYLPIATSVLTIFLIYAVGLVHDQGFNDPVWLFNGQSFRWIHDTLIGWGMMDGASGPKSISVNFLGFLTLNFLAMFGICMLCHGELVRRRPDPRHLTLYYLMIAAGGALGGAAVTLLAPRVFDTYFEWELTMFLGCLLAIGLILRGLVNVAFSEGSLSIGKRLAALTPVMFLLAVPATIAIVDLVIFLLPSNDGVLYRVRNFYGALSVREKDADNVRQATIVLRHGAITHGSQFKEASRHGQPITYFGTPSGVGRTFNTLRKAPPPGGIDVGAVGLGTGTLAAYVGAGDSITFYEINPAVIEISESGEWFTYLHDCKQRGADYKTMLGDARLTLEREFKEGGSRRYHVLVLDAFSGDAIPAHLLTEEAFKIYVDHLATPEAGGLHGAIVVHISNRYVNLDPIVRGAAERFGLQVARIESSPVPTENISGSTWITLSRNETLLSALRPFVAPPDPDEEPQAPILWTDRDSNLYDVLKRKPNVKETIRRLWLRLRNVI
ncbi:MAG: hypothetical protein WD669_09155 [Pirellulales bacterium]